MSIGMPLKIHGATVGVEIKADNASQIPFRVKNSSGADLFTINGDGTITNSTSALGIDQTISVAVSNAELSALRATPKTLVAAPGTGKYLEFVSAVLFLDYGTVGFTESADNMAIRYTDGSGTIVSQAIECTGFIDQTADTSTNALPKVDAISAKSACENKALVLHNTGDGEWGNSGDSVMRVKITYRIHSTGW